MLSGNGDAAAMPLGTGWRRGVGRSGQVRSRNGEAGYIDSAKRLKFMCSLWSVNSSPLPPFGTTGQRWRTRRGSSGMQVASCFMLHSAGHRARDTDICLLKLFESPIPRWNSREAAAARFIYLSFILILVTCTLHLECGDGFFVLFCFE